MIRAMNDRALAAGPVLTYTAELASRFGGSRQ